VCCVCCVCVVCKKHYVLVLFCEFVRVLLCVCVVVCVFAFVFFCL